jgi:hypothetical protein
MVLILYLTHICLIKRGLDILKTFEILNPFLQNLLKKGSFILFSVWRLTGEMVLKS